MNKRHINIPVFIPHLGCPNDCVFCNQRTISGVKDFSAENVIPIIEAALETTSSDDYIEIAFFGGSFTGINKTLMENLLSIANDYLKQGRIHSIRCSTRPDYIDNSVLNILKKYGVRHIELGIQSASDDVLLLSHRGHTVSDTIKAASLIKANGFILGGQMMIGLPGATHSDEIETAKLIVAIGAEEARIYPTIVFCGTELANMTKAGIYNPLSIDEAVIRSADVFSIFTDSGVKVLRIGLCDSENLHDPSTYYAGPNHAAIGELVTNEYYYKKARRIFDDFDINIIKNSDVVLYVAKGHVSKLVGQRKLNKIRLIDDYDLSTLKVVERDDLNEYMIDVEILRVRKDKRCT